MKKSTLSRARGPRRWLVHALLGILSTLVVLCGSPAKGQQPAEETWPSVQLRVAWGGGEARLWRGKIAVSRGKVTKKRLLGIESDEPASIWQDGPALAVEQPRPRTYDGVDILVNAPLDATLTIDLQPVDGTPNEVAVVQVPIREMLANYYNGQLDEFNNRLLVRRESGDILRLQFENPSLIVDSGDTIRARVRPYMLPAAAGTQLQLRMSLTAARGSDVLWSDRRDVTLDTSGSGEEFPLEFSAPENEGAYDLHVEAVQTGFGARLGLKQTVAKRSLQFVVMREAGPMSASSPRPAEWKELLSVDLTTSDWWSKLTRWPLTKGSMQPLSSGHSTRVTLPTTQYGERSFTVLPASKQDAITWEAVPLKVDEIGKPHIVEVEYPADAPQVLGISLLEPNAAGRLVPIGLDSGAYTPDSKLTTPTGNVAVHRLVFWPKTRQPMLLLTNQGKVHSCYFGKIRLLSGPAELPPAFESGTPTLETGRQWLAYFEKPLLAENFGASEFIDEWSGRSLDDWHTFHTAVTRLGEYLQYQGQTGAIITVATDGSAIYPSETIPPTPRFDTGAFFDSSQDPFAKDVMELLLREFDQRELKLIPAIDFATQIPSLEQLARSGDASTASLFWIGAQGRWLPASEPPVRGRAPYYNILNPTVQEALLAVIREAGRRACRHPSFSGLAIRLGADGYAQLPGPEWGLDDFTVGQFERETGIKLNTGDGPDRFARRKELLVGPHLDVWLNWRAEQLRKFYERAASQLREIRSDAKLYLVGTGMLATPSARTKLHPLHADRDVLSRALLEIGIDPKLLAGSEALTFIQPQRIRAHDALVSGEVAEADDFLATTLQSDVDRVFADADGTIFFHPPHEFRLASFEAASPFAGTSAWIVSQLSPAGAWNQERFAHALAMRDERLLIDGGWLLPMGQDESLRKMMAVYRQLPNAPFEAISADSAQPVVVRAWQKSERTCCYMVNDSPWPVKVKLRFRSSSNARGQMIGELPGPVTFQSQADESWTVMELGPYELKGLWIWAAGLRQMEAEVDRSGAETSVTKRIADLWESLNRMSGQRPSLMELSNGDFESPTPFGRPASWQTSAGGTLITLQGSNLAQGGEAAAIFRADANGASLVSDPLPTPEAGRLAVSAWLKTPRGARPPAMRIAIVGEISGRNYYRYAPVRAGENSEGLGEEWKQFVFHVQDLPSAGLENLRVRFDMMEPGEVAIDSVQVFDNLYDSYEINQISALLLRAKISSEKGNWNDTLQMLQGYWPRFLDDHAPKQAEQLAGPNERQPAEQGADSRSGILDQVIPEWMKWR